MNILAIGAHPDDIELGCGGLLLKAARSGHNVFMYVLTRGAASGDPARRTEELIESAKYMGAKTLWVDNFEDTRVAVSSSLINHIEYFIHRADPHMILTHSIRDYHHDHRAIAEATTEAARFNQNVMAYEVPLTKDFNPQVYYDISDVLEEKTELITIFGSQSNKIFTKSNAVRGLAEYRAFQSRLKTSINAVESFEVIKLCFAKDFSLYSSAQQSPPQAIFRDIDLNDILEFKHVPEVRAEVPNGQLNELTIQDAIGLVHNRE